MSRFVRIFLSLQIDLLKNNLMTRLVDIVSSDVLALTSSETVPGNGGVMPGIAQLALIGLQLLCRLLGNKYPELFISVSVVFKTSLQVSSVFSHMLRRLMAN